MLAAFVCHLRGSPMRCHSASLTVLLLASTMLAPATVSAMPGNGTCIEGDCDNGIGVFLSTYDNNTYRGPFSNGLFAPSASYEVQDPAHPGVTYQFRTDANRDWSYVEVWRTPTQFYAGSMAKAVNPFTRLAVNSFKEGRLEGSDGLVYEGQFEYVSLPPTTQRGTDVLAAQVGIYMFSGTRTNSRTGARDYGIFASEAVRPKHDLILAPADPQKIAGIRAQYQAAVSSAQAQDAAVAQAQAQAQAQSSAGTDLFGALLQTAAGGLLASSMGQMSGAMGGLNATNLTQVVGVMTGQTSPDAAMALMAQDYMANGLGAAVGASTAQDFAALGRSIAADKALPSSTAVTSTTGRVPALESMTLPCSNENGAFTGTSKVPKAARDCRAEVIAHRKVQCRSDWRSDPSFAAMQACFRQNGIADLSQW